MAKRKPWVFLPFIGGSYNNHDNHEKHVARRQIGGHSELQKDVVDPGLPSQPTAEEFKNMDEEQM